MPDCAVPSHQASMSAFSTPAEPSVSLTASTSRSSVLRSQCSLNCVQPIPTIATWSLIPWLAMVIDSLSSDGRRRAGRAFQK
jgi:hypothetical protein